MSEYLSLTTVGKGIFSTFTPGRIFLLKGGCTITAEPPLSNLSLKSEFLIFSCYNYNTKSYLYFQIKPPEDFIFPLQHFPILWQPVASFALLILMYFPTNCPSTVYCKTVLQWLLSILTWLLCLFVSGLFKFCFLVTHLKLDGWLFNLSVSLWSISAPSKYSFSTNSGYVSAIQTAAC